MIRNNKWKLLISSIFILLPAIFGLLMWNKLPPSVTLHWGADGVADGWSGRGFAVLFPPLFLLALHWICIWVTNRENRRREQNPKVLSMVLWICPILSLCINGMVYAVAFGKDFSPATLVPVVIGLAFLFIGNYMPKCKQNRTIGIKVPWAYSSEENWNRTHRVGGRLWVVGGVLFLLSAFLPEKLLPFIMVGLLVLMIVIPTVYSYLFYKKERREGTAVPLGKTLSKQGTSKKPMLVGILLTVAILVGCLVLCFTGNVTVSCGEESFAVEADYYGDFQCAYADVRSIEYREFFDGGSRTAGFGSPRLSLGQFKNEELGSYLRYGYTQCDAVILLQIEGDRVVAISGRDVAETQAIYETLLAKITGTT